VCIWLFKHKKTERRIQTDKIEDYCEKFIFEKNKKKNIYYKYYYFYKKVHDKNKN